MFGNDRQCACSISPVHLSKRRTMIWYVLTWYLKRMARTIREAIAKIFQKCFIFNGNVFRRIPRPNICNWFGSNDNHHKLFGLDALMRFLRKSDEREIRPKRFSLIIIPKIIGVVVFVPIIRGIAVMAGNISTISSGVARNVLNGESRLSKD